jgi:hypothetical protein
MKRTLAAALTVVCFAAVAQPVPQGVPEAPSLPPPSYQGEAVEPEVTIIETEKGTIYEYRVRGQLYMVRVKPVIGPPYYLLDTNGDGLLDAQQDRVWNNSIPQWLLYSW